MSVVCGPLVFEGFVHTKSIT